MANLSFAMLFFVIVFINPSITSCKIIPSISFTASNQLNYWFENIQNSMPEAILSKLSPLNKDDSEFFTSLVSDQSVSYNSKLCSLANLACYSELNSIKPLKVHNYNIYVNIAPSLAFQTIDPFSFFRMSILKQGNKVHLPNLGYQFPQRAFLPYQIASKISLVENDLQKMFPQSFVDPGIKSYIETTLLYCNTTAQKVEIKSCPKSLEEMIEFSKTTLGSKHLISVTPKSLKGSGEELIIESIKKLNANQTVSCHEVFLPFASYFCHKLTSTQIYAVDLVKPKTKAPVNMVLAVCHMDTSSWSSNHPSFKILNLSPGKGEVCHWMTKNDLFWIGTAENMF